MHPTSCPDPIEISRQAMRLLRTADIVAKDAWDEDMPARLRSAAYDLLDLVARGAHSEERLAA